MDNCLEKTDHDNIKYDPLTEAYVVDLTPGTWCEVFGSRRYEMAVKIADKVSKEPEKCYCETADKGDWPCKFCMKYGAL